MKSRNLVLPTIVSLIIVMAGQARAGSIVVEHPYARATPAGASTGAAFMIIRNSGTADDMLLGGASPAAKTVQVHEMTMDGGIMRMRQVPGGLKVPAGGNVQLRPGSYHIMLIDLGGPLSSGKSFPLTLHFRKAGDVPVQVSVRSLSGD